jgi:regulator of nucleoside diphosphate kinase
MLESVAVAAHGQAELWAALHKETEFHFAECERHCLIALALSADDDVAAHLLLKKMKLARIVARPALPRGVVRLDSRVAYRHGRAAAGQVRLCHPSAIECGGVDVAGLLGAGLIGLEAGQSVLWPGADGRLATLEVLAVENDERRPEPRRPGRVIPFRKSPARRPEDEPEPPPSAA